MKRGSYFLSRFLSDQCNKAQGGGQSCCPLCVLSCKMFGGTAIVSSVIIITTGSLPVVGGAGVQLAIQVLAGSATQCISFLTACSGSLTCVLALLVISSHHHHLFFKERQKTQPTMFTSPSSGRPAPYHPTADEIATLRGMMAPGSHEVLVTSGEEGLLGPPGDKLLTRWLVARKGIMKATFESLTKHVEWRKTATPNGRIQEDT